MRLDPQKLHDSSQWRIDSFIGKSAEEPLFHVEVVCLKLYKINFVYRILYIYMWKEDCTSNEPISLYKRKIALQMNQLRCGNPFEDMHSIFNHALLSIISTGKSLPSKSPHVKGSSSKSWDLGQEISPKHIMENEPFQGWKKERNFCVIFAQPERNLNVIWT